MDMAFASAIGLGRRLVTAELYSEGAPHLLDGAGNDDDVARDARIHDREPMVPRELDDEIEIGLRRAVSRGKVLARHELALDRDAGRRPFYIELRPPGQLGKTHGLSLGGPTNRACLHTQPLLSVQLERRHEYGGQGRCGCVQLPNLGSATGHVQVSAYGTGGERCKVAAWLPSLPAGSAEQVDIRCFTSTGPPADTRFAMTYVDKITLTGGAASPPSVSGPSGAYALADQPTSPSYTPNLSYQWNDFGSTNSITRTGVGAYQVHFPSLAMNSGDVQVTAYGFGSDYCKVKSWAPGVWMCCASAALRAR